MGLFSGGNTSETNYQIDNSKKNLNLNHGDNNIGSVGDGAFVNVERADAKALTAMSKDNAQTTQKTIDAMAKLSGKGLDTAANLNKNSLDFARNVMGESYETISENNEKNAGLVRTSLQVGSQQSKDAINALGGVITRNQIGAAQVQVENMNKLIIMVGAVLVFGFMFNRKR